MEFRALASSSEGNAYVLREGSLPPLLIDAGIRYAELQRALSFQVMSLAGCLLSHCHGDHSRAVPDLLKTGVDVYASAETWEEMKVQNHHRAKTILDATTRIGGWLVLPFKAVHDAPGTRGFLIDSPAGKRLVYVTDTMYCPYRFEHLTHIAIEANFSRDRMRSNVFRGDLGSERYRRTSQNHMSVERVLAFLDAHDLSKIEEIHLLHLSDANSDEAEFKELVARKTGKPVYVAAKRQGAL